VTTAAEPSTRNIQAIADLEREALHDRTGMERMTDAITAAAGSPGFVIVHAVWFTIWIVLNVTRSSFDPFPFGALTLIVSLEAIFLTGFVLMTQNRMTHQAEKRAHLDLQVNLLAEQELTMMLQMLTRLCEHQGVPVPPRDEKVEAMSRETDIHQLAAQLERELDTGAAHAAEKP
jgi:uncharacterized membrane protein